MKFKTVFGAALASLSFMAVAQLAQADLILLKVSPNDIGNGINLPGPHGQLSLRNLRDENGNRVDLYNFRGMELREVQTTASSAASSWSLKLMINGNAIWNTKMIQGMPGTRLVSMVPAQDMINEKGDLLRGQRRFIGNDIMDLRIEATSDTQLLSVNVVLDDGNTFVQPPQPPVVPPVPSINGWLDGVQNGSVNGWVCVPGDSREVTMALSVGANIPSGGRPILQTNQTKLVGIDSFSIAARCGDGAHRFSIPLREVYESARANGIDLRGGGVIYASALFAGGAVGIGGTVFIPGAPDVIFVRPPVIDGRCQDDTCVANDGFAEIRRVIEPYQTNRAVDCRTEEETFHRISAEMNHVWLRTYAQFRNEQSRTSQLNFYSGTVNSVNKTHSDRMNTCQNGDELRRKEEAKHKADADRIAAEKARAEKAAADKIAAEKAAAKVGADKARAAKVAAEKACMAKGLNPDCSPKKK